VRGRVRTVMVALHLSFILLLS